MKMRFFFTGTNDAASRLICRVTGGIYSHCGVVFYEHPDAEKDAGFFFESRAKVFLDAQTGQHKTGVRGPRHFDGIVDWAMDDPDTRRYEVLPLPGYLPVTASEAWESFHLLSAAVHRVKYAHLQIFQNWIAQRLRIRIGVGCGDNDRWTCSETCLLALPARLWPWYRVPRITQNQITPDGDKMASVYAGTSAMCGV